MKNNDNFWSKLDHPIIALSPMDGVTDQPYRHIQKKYGKPAVIYTEFTNVEGVCHGAVQMLKDFLYDETQRPIVAQIYGKTPNNFRQVATLLCELGFDGVDINMGCPAKSVDASGSGAALIKSPKLAQEIIRETQAGVQDYQNGKRARDCADITDEIATEVEKRHKQLPIEFQKVRNIPVSVKTRIGYDESVVEEWISTLIEMKPAAIALHGRTLRQQYSGLADWDEIAKAAKLCRAADIPILGNGDTKTIEEAYAKVEKYGVDGVLIGRASFGNPFVFLKEAEAKEKLENINIFELALEHCKLFEETYKDFDRYHFMPMRKHLGWYSKGIPGAKEIRIKLVRTDNAQEVEQIFKDHDLI